MSEAPDDATPQAPFGPVLAANETVFVGAVGSRYDG
jgi:hypothetical protein